MLGMLNEFIMVNIYLLQKALSLFLSTVLWTRAREVRLVYQEHVTVLPDHSTAPAQLNQVMFDTLYTL